MKIAAGSRPEDLRSALKRAEFMMDTHILVVTKSSIDKVKLIRVTKPVQLADRFYHDLVADGISESFVGISTGSVTDVAVLDLYSPELKRFSLGTHRPYNAFAVSSTSLIFHDPGRCEFGAIDLASSRWWSNHDAAAEFVGGASNPSVLVVHSKNVLRFYDLNSGEMMGESPQSGCILGFGSGWKLVEREDQIEFIGRVSTSRFPRGGHTCFARSFGDRVVFIERQGSIRIVNAWDGTLVLEEKALEGSEFRKAVISEDGTVTFTQHYFARPEETFVHRSGIDGAGRASARVPVSGSYALIKGGREIVFATRRIYCCCDGSELRSF